MNENTRLGGVEGALHCTICIGYCTMLKFYAVLEPERRYIITKGEARGDYVTSRRFLNA